MYEDPGALRIPNRGDEPRATGEQVDGTGPKRVTPKTGERGTVVQTGTSGVGGRKLETLEPRTGPWGTILDGDPHRPRPTTTTPLTTRPGLHRGGTNRVRSRQKVHDRSTTRVETRSLGAPRVLRDFEPPPRTTRGPRQKTFWGLSSLRNVWEQTLDHTQAPVSRHTDTGRQ